MIEAISGTEQFDSARRVTAVPRKSWENGRSIPLPSAPQEAVGRDQPLQRLPSVAAAGGDGLARGRVQADGRWRRGLGRSGRTGWANDW